MATLPLRHARLTLDHTLRPGAVVGFLAVLLAGLVFAGVNIALDTDKVGTPLALGAFAFLGLALIIALGFEFVNGFHDTANAVATVIYTHSLKPVVAVVWSGAWNFIGVLASSGVVAYSIITLLPVDLILNVGSGAGYAMIFALLLAAVIWNLGTWWLGIPNSSSHALIGSVLGVGLANQLMTAGTGTSGVEWGQAWNVLLALLVSPLLGFVGSMGLLWTMKHLLPDPQLYREPEQGKPPPLHIRLLLIFTCTSVSFAHGGNDGQKGMGLIMLILIGVAPAAYALNRTMPDSATPAFVQAAHAADGVFMAHAIGAPRPTLTVARATVRQALRARAFETAQVQASLSVVNEDIVDQLHRFGSLRQVPAAATENMRTSMYMVADSLHQIAKQKPFYAAPEDKALATYSGLLEAGTRYIPTWVKVTVALALGLGTMVGWKRIVVTVGEKIGTTHLTYGMGASAELVAAATILLAEVKGMPVSTTHILSSGVAGATVASGASLHMAMIRNIVLAWVTTLPAAMAISGGLYVLFRAVAALAG